MVDNKALPLHKCLWHGLPCTFNQCAKSSLYTPDRIEIKDLGRRLLLESPDQIGEAWFEFFYKNMRVKSGLRNLFRIFGLEKEATLQNVSIEVWRGYGLYEPGFPKEKDYIEFLSRFALPELNRRLEGDIARLRKLNVPIIGEDKRFTLDTPVYL